MLRFVLEHEHEHPGCVHGGAQPRRYAGSFRRFGPHQLDQLDRRRPDAPLSAPPQPLRAFRLAPLGGSPELPSGRRLTTAHRSGSDPHPTSPRPGRPLRSSVRMEPSSSWGLQHRSSRFLSRGRIGARLSGHARSIIASSLPGSGPAHRPPGHGGRLRRCGSRGSRCRFVSRCRLVEPGRCCAGSLGWRGPANR